MRYYDLSITPKGSTTPIKQWQSHPNGIRDPGALNILFDMPVLSYSSPSGGQTLTVEGISLQDISQAQQFAGMTLTLKAGMKGPDYPLINPSQAGTIISGYIFQSFGNWIGNDMTVDFVLYPSIYTNDNPGNLTLIWPKGERLSDALTHCLQVAYPNMPISMNISPNLVNDHDQHHASTTLENLASFVGDITDQLFHDRVYITIQRGQIFVFDDTYVPAAVQLNFTDFVGQPTWIQPNIIQIKTVLRADLQIGDIVRMPEGLQNAPGVITTTGASLPSSIKYKSTFQNTFTIFEARQIGDFRSSDSGNWCSVFNCVTN
jgi:hypothetical protein